MSRGQCPENERLLHVFAEAVDELLMFQEQHFHALVNGETDSERYEVLIHLANEKRQAAKYAYLMHLEAHGCERTAAFVLVEQKLNGQANLRVFQQRRKVADVTKG